MDFEALESTRTIKPFLDEGRRLSALAPYIERVLRPATAAEGVRMRRRA